MWGSYHPVNALYFCVHSCLDEEKSGLSCMPGENIPTISFHLDTNVILSKYNSLDLVRTVLCFIIFSTEFAGVAISMTWTRQWMKSTSRQKTWNKFKKLYPRLLVQQLILMKYAAVSDNLFVLLFPPSMLALLNHFLLLGWIGGRARRTRRSWAGGTALATCNNSSCSSCSSACRKATSEEGWRRWWWVGWIAERDGPLRRSFSYLCLTRSILSTENKYISYQSISIQLW